MSVNVDTATVKGFSDEWSAYDQSRLSSDELAEMFDAYFRIFAWDSLPEDAAGFDLGCGSGRWARLVAPRVGKLHCIDASPGVLEVAKRNLAGLPNCEFHVASVSDCPLP